jgi:type II secretion system protein G
VKKMIKIKRNKKGFTLIELLVVIAIIGLLATIVLVSLNNARNKANDTRIKADLSQMMLGIEMYYADNSAYPASGACGVAGVGTVGVIAAADPGAVCSGRPLFDSNGTTFIQRLPDNPRSGKVYTWASTNNYTLTALLTGDTVTYTCSNGSCY